ncbi:MAG: hypothetical protein J5I53_05125 [Bradyrhizobiaceae bacterium]|nr:hypothetical protein [Bradyrhizobiaceae bacterium]
MDQTNAVTPDYIATPLFGVLRAIGFGEHNDLDYFKSHALFWSMERLLGCYERVMPVLELEPDQRPFLGADNARHPGERRDHCFHVWVPAFAGMTKKEYTRLSSLRKQGSRMLFPGSPLSRG